MINELVAQIEKKDAPIVVGLDPMLSYVPEYIQKKAFSEYGETLKVRPRQSGNTIKELSMQLTI